VRYALAFTLAPVLYLTACGGSGNDIADPAAGTLEISTSTAGPEPDLDGYTFQIDGGPITPIGSSATTSSDLATGTHSLRLSGLADNCSVADNPRNVTVVGGQTATTTFPVTCTPSTGSLAITASTTGSSPDADGYQVTVDGADRGALPTNGSVTLTDFPSGAHSVGLSGLAANCTVEGDNPRSADIAGGQTAGLSFTVTCTTPPAEAGTLQVVTGTSGPIPDPDGYTFAVDGGAAQVIGLNSTVALANTSASVHTVQLSGAATNCTVDGTNPRPVTVNAGSTAEVRFTVTCGSSSALVWTHMDTGTSFYLQGIWGSGASDLFTTGETSGGDPTSGILRFDGQGWTEQLTAPNARLQGIWGSSPTDVFAVGFKSISAGPGGLLYHYGGSGWTPMEEPVVPDPLYVAVWGSSGSDVYAVGEYFEQHDKLLISHFDGISWKQVTLDSPDFQIATDVYAGSASDVWVVGYLFPQDAYFWRHYDGSIWTGTSTEGGVLNGVWASGPNDVFATGFDENGGFILHYDGQAWSRMIVPRLVNAFSDIWGSSGSDVYAAGSGAILHYDGNTWSQVFSEGGSEAFGLSATDVYVVGGNGSVLHGTPPAAIASLGRSSRAGSQSRLMVASRPERRELRGARSYGFPIDMPRPRSLERRLSGR
jgi:hypothetical protein